VTNFLTFSHGFLCFFRALVAPKIQDESLIEVFGWQNEMNPLDWLWNEQSTPQTPMHPKFPSPKPAPWWKVYSQKRYE
jgi:hypothetical protein